jgi:hypothetical protein
MRVMRDSWTDGRLDDLNGRVSEGFAGVDANFARVDADIRELRGDVKELGRETSARFDSMHRTLVHGFVAMFAALIAGFGTLAGVVAF